MSKIRTSMSTTPLTVNRLEALADGLFAIVMTLLVLELSIPVIAESSVDAELLGKLLELWPKLLIYMLSFVVLGDMWVNHHYMFHFITRSDGKLVWMNIIALMFVALVPFTTSLLGEYNHAQVAVVVYGINVILILTMSLIMWIHITGKQTLADRAVETEAVRSRKIMYVGGCCLYLISIGISFVSPIASLCIYGLAALLPVIISWRDSHGLLSKVFVRT